MKNRITTLAIISTLALAASSYGSVTLSTAAVGSSTAFSASSLSGLNGNLSFSDIGSGGASIGGAQVQGGFGTGVAWGEVFNWAGSANGDVLSAYSMILVGANPSRTYQPVLLDLGTSIYNGFATPFNPSLHPNLLGSSTVTLPNVGANTFLEFDLSGSDAVTLTVGHSYAFGLWNVDASTVGTDVYFLRAAGVVADPNGMPFYTGANGINDTSAQCSGWGGSARNILVGLYTTPVPEPSTMTLLGLGALAGLGYLRRRKA